MRQERKLYEYMYQAVISDIESGIYMTGQTLPPQQQLCRKYNVGITTVRKVMKMLDENGYVHTALGQPAVVICPVSLQMRINALVSRRNAIADAYKGLGLLLPVLFREAATRCREEDMAELKAITAKVTDTLTMSMLYKQANAFFTRLLRPLNNQLIMELELDAENYLYIPYFNVPDVKNPQTLSADQLKKWLENAIAQIEQKKYDDFYESTRTFYIEAARRVDEYLLALSYMADDLPSAENNIRWFKIKDGSELYSRLAMTILRRITSREFDEQKYLPSIPKLMEEYGVMKDTASRALALLNALGVTRTIDKKGTVISTEFTKAFKGSVDFSDPTIRQRLILFLEALEIMALTAHTCTSAFTQPPVVWSPLPESRLYSVSGDHLGPLSFQLLMHSVIHLVPCHSLKNIFLQLDDILIWGYYLLSIDESYYPSLEPLTEIAQKVRDALKEPGYAGFSNALDQAFRKIYQNVCLTMSHFPETADLKTYFSG